jgi:hypothetical protein
LCDAGTTYRAVLAEARASNAQAEVERARRAAADMLGELADLMHDHRDAMILREAAGNLAAR